MRFLLFTAFLLSGVAGVSAQDIKDVKSDNSDKGLKTKTTDGQDPDVGAKPKEGANNPDDKTITIKLRGSSVVVFAGNIERASIKLPSKPVKFQLKGKRFYAACRKNGLIIVDFSDSYRPYIYKILDAGKDVVDFTLTGDTVSVISAVFSMNAHAVSDSGGPVSLVDAITAGKIDAGRITGTPGKFAGTIVSVSHGFAVFTIAPDTQIREGDRVEVRTERQSTGLPFKTLGIQGRKSRVICVANIVEIRSTRAVFELGRGDNPEIGDNVYFSERPVTGSRYMPSRVGGIYRLGIEFIPVFGGSGGDDNAYLSGLILARASVHFRRPFSIAVGVTPFQFAGSSDFSLSKYTGANMYGLFTYEVDQFAIGLGFGYQQPVLHGENPHNRQGVTLVQYLRLGSQDGLNLTGELHAVYSDDNEEKSRRAMMGMLKIDLNVPLTDSITFFSRYMGDGRTLIHFSGGLKTMLSGKGGSGTVIIPVTIGYTSMTPWYDSESKHKIQGSSFSIGIEKVF
ncbi:hypothetical protein KKF34_04520 [Myxococcota bacterium]|nr:hypothetical protein [Myxococcota bacterium]MBU1381034.1 hypothetical protein [Myxococcota bacterium]MBU1496123.1 hypothetical protein [Myxococcota bacterium]